MQQSPYVVGIDLGTSNSSLAYLETGLEEDGAKVRTLPIKQIVAPGEEGEAPVLPSNVYLPGPHELPPESLALPWMPDGSHAVGLFAREQAARLPHRVVSSSKSWLCHPGVDRRADLLPWAGERDGKKISPVDAAVLVLEHLRESWNASMAEDEETKRLEAQEITLTVPASFDAVARELTVEAAERAGFQQLTLLEEPQAAFYAWLDAVGESWRDQINPGEVVLVCDLGGGTTDFSLITVDDEDGNLSLRRIAVGDHILLGGDNFDLALARMVEQSEGWRLDSWQLNVLWHVCRSAKERLLEEEELESVPVAVPGRGSSLVGGTLSSELTRAHVEQILLGGFFPEVSPDDHPVLRSRVGLQELGLPYEQEPAITKHLARFLSTHRHALEGLGDERSFCHPQTVLFNGGVFRSRQLRKRILDILSTWCQGEGGEAVRELHGTDTDLAVARGAARFAWVRRGNGIRIRGGTARAYYVGIESSMPAIPGLAPPMKAICVAPFGMEEGTEAELADREFGLIVGQAAEFRFYGSTQRRDDTVGTEVEQPDRQGIDELDPIETVIVSEHAEAGSTLAVRLRSVVTEIGTLQLWAVTTDGKEKFRLEFAIREASGAKA